MRHTGSYNDVASGDGAHNIMANTGSEHMPDASHNPDSHPGDYVGNNTSGSVAGPGPPTAEGALNEHYAVADGGGGGGGGGNSGRDGYMKFSQYLKFERELLDKIDARHAYYDEKYEASEAQSRKLIDMQADQLTKARAEVSKYRLLYEGLVAVRNERELILSKEVAELRAKTAEYEYGLSKTRAKDATILEAIKQSNMIALETRNHVAEMAASNRAFLELNMEIKAELTLSQDKNQILKEDNLVAVDYIKELIATLDKVNSTSEGRTNVHNTLTIIASRFEEAKAYVNLRDQLDVNVRAVGLLSEEIAGWRSRWRELELDHNLSKLNNIVTVSHSFRTGEQG